MGRRAMLGLAGFEWATSPKRTLSEASNNACEVPEVIDAALPYGSRTCEVGLRAELYLRYPRQKKRYKLHVVFFLFTYVRISF